RRAPAPGPGPGSWSCPATTAWGPPGSRRAGRSLLPPEAEVAAAAALHDGLASREREGVVEALHHGAIPVAVDQHAEVRQAELLEQLGVAAAGDVERQAVLRLVDDLEVEAAGAGPHRFRNLAHARDVAAEPFAPFAALLV